jgi:hypothetical protein
MLVIVVLFATLMPGEVQLLIGGGTGTLEVWGAARRLEEEAARLRVGAGPLEGRGEVVELEGLDNQQVRLSPEDIVIAVTWKERGTEPVLDYLAAKAPTHDHLYAAGRALHEWGDFNIWNSRYEHRLRALAAVEEPAAPEEPDPLAVPGRPGPGARPAIVRANRLPHLGPMGRD